MIFVNSSTPMNAQSSSSCSLEFLLVKCLSFSSKSPFFVQTVFYLQSTKFDLILEEFRNLSRLENDVVQLQELWPIDWRLTCDRSAPTRFSRILSRDRSAYIPRSIGASSGWLRVVEPIDRLMTRDRSAMLLPFGLFNATLADRSANEPRSIGDGSVYMISSSFAPKCSVLFTFSPRFPYLCLYHLYTHKTR